MSGLSLSDLVVLSQPLERTIAYAVWYATLLWLPVRGLAAVLDHMRGVHTHTIHRAQLAQTGEGYGVGMNILPPM